MTDPATQRRSDVGDRVVCDGDVGTIDWVSDSPLDYRVRFDDDGTSAYVHPSDLEPAP